MATICQEFLIASQYVAQWIAAQSAVGEESITDWLLYHLSSRLKNLHYVKFTRHEEARITGADWEWWIVGDKRALKLRIQAKRVFQKRDNYPGLAYSNKHGLQIERLLSNAAQENALAFYVFYSDASPQKTLCIQAVPALERSLFLSAANDVNTRFVQPARTTLLGDAVLAWSTPLECLVCCPVNPDSSDAIDRILSYLHTYHPLADESERLGIHRDLPYYVSTLLDRDMLSGQGPLEQMFEGAPRVGGLVVLDLRSQS